MMDPFLNINDSFHNPSTDRNSYILKLKFNNSKPISNLIQKINNWLKIKQ